jgi:hypothetical protein
MSTDSFKSLCAELVDDLEMSDWPYKLKEVFRADIARARAALSQPEPQGPTDLRDETLLNEADAYFLYGEGKYTASLEEVVAFARRMFLAGQSWGRPAIKPVPGVEGADA